jgi:hypothetical protein
MGIRDDEINRLKKYAEGLGIKITLVPFYRGSGGGEWDMSSREITIYTRDDWSKTDYILTILHELGHHLDWVYNDKKDSAISYKAYAMLNQGHMYGPRLDMSQKYRDVLLAEEEAGVYYMDILHKELDLKIPLWKVKMQQELDLYDYVCLSKEGRFSTTKEYRAHRKTIKAHYKKTYGDV